MDEISGFSPPSIPDSPPSIPDSPGPQAAPDTSSVGDAAPAAAPFQQDTFNAGGADPAARTQPDAERVGGESAAAVAQRAALAGAQGASGFDSNPSAVAPTSTGPRKEIDMTPRVYGSPEWGPGYTVKESERDREARTDGKIQGADGRIFEPEKGKGIDGIPPVNPTDPSRVTNQAPVLAIYGVFTDAAAAAENNKALADAVNRPVVGVRNATQGLTHGEDVLETLWDQKVHNAPIPSAKSASDIITDRLSQNQPLEIHAHSQGAVVTSQAIERARGQLIKEHGLTPQQADDRLKLLTVNTYGGAAASYPNGPQYTHNINRLDYVAATTGLGVTGLDVGTQPGAGAVINRQTQFREPHGFTGYLDWVHPPSQRVQR